MADSNFNTINNTNTLLGQVNQLRTQMNSSFEAMLDTTLNSKHNNRPNDIPASLPTLKYFGIGINGFYNINDSTLSQPYIPRETNMDLYLPIPFRVVPIESDLSAGDRDKYRMRTRQTFNGLEYYCYWLKLIEFPDNSIDVVQIDLSSNVSEEYVFDASNLNPVAVKTSGVDIIENATSKVIVKTSGEAKITGQEIAEAISIMYDGDFRRARISEFGFYTGEDKTVNGTTFEGANFDYTEAIYAQLATHRCSTGTDMSDINTIFTEGITYQSGSTYLQV